MHKVILFSVLCAALSRGQTKTDADDLRRALDFQQSGDYSGAVLAYRQYLDSHPDAAAGVRSNLGAALAHQG